MSFVHVCIYMLCVYMCVHTCAWVNTHACVYNNKLHLFSVCVCTHTCAVGHVWKSEDSLYLLSQLDSPLPYILRQGFSLNLDFTDWLGQLVSKPKDPPVPTPSTGTQAFYMGAGNLNQVATLSWQVLRGLNHLLSPHWMILNQLSSIIIFAFTEGLSAII